jgi:hypothetical protein
MDANDPGSKVLFFYGFVMTEKLDQTASRAAGQLRRQDPSPAVAQSPGQCAYSPCFVRVDMAMPGFYLPGLALLLVGQGSNYVDG